MKRQLRKRAIIGAIVAVIGVAVIGAIAWAAGVDENAAAINAAADKPQSGLPGPNWAMIHADQKAQAATESWLVANPGVPFGGLAAEATDGKLDTRATVGPGEKAVITADRPFTRVVVCYKQAGKALVIDDRAVVVTTFGPAEDYTSSARVITLQAPTRRLEFVQEDPKTGLFLDIAEVRLY